MHPTSSVILFGTEESVDPPLVLTAGSLTADLETGNLRYIRIGGVEVLRAIAFLVRDRNWGTYNPEISNLSVEDGDDRFKVTYDAVCRDDEQELTYSATIEGRSDGSLRFEATGSAINDFVTNRTGFVVLHALEDVVDQPVTVEHTDGKLVESRFPKLINPACPFEDVRALTHTILPGVRAAVRMEGDAFEMEDHRNWMDASYKTYVRPLALPWPYTIGAGEKISQSVSLTLDGSVPASATSADTEAVVTIGESAGHAMPRIGLAVPPEHAEAALNHADLLKGTGVSHLVCHFDQRKGHDAGSMRLFQDLGAALDAELVLEAVVPCVDESDNPSADLDILRRDMAAIRDAASGVEFKRVAVSPASDLKCTLPGSVFPPAPDWVDLFAAARDAFPSAIVGGGMFSYFTELNRKRPPAELLDFICHSGCPIVHAGDDVSVMETLQALPSIFDSVRAFGGGKPYWVFPTAIAMRANPYGAAPAENPKNIRQAMNRVDPRERGLLGAAWYAGYLARAAAAGVDAVTLGAVAGPSGVVYSAQDHHQPWFDEVGPQVLPHYHVIAGHAALRGEVHAVAVSNPGAIQALCVSKADGLSAWICNLTGEPRAVRIDGSPDEASVLVLDEQSFEAACRDAAWRESAPRTTWTAAEVLTLSPYAVAELRFR
ncbi:MAG TPA: hypothetical protein VK862_19640 [Afifellaceae bacterium]|nr:hypothetical protein [Afifellaceae bacterium]